ncbi:hormogonium polysaccharide secretion pseudopilin HpsB [Okeania sp. SIO1I7]|uniref:hormogonium polysaccharide secretion pseudopilin HpsB n=1 Tax=Okeania sp. SIO1I7 TaxID=2607772 RepID=UPI0013FA3565|nr:hormogonium polysaccharide secretion pseudopilin HpsB [Okeania sp. SIO1I7]NET29680.1 type II secretion system protein [Okeania sp. SIO1I7]
MKLQKIWNKYRKASESGYTIIEGLVAIIVVATLLSAIGPVIALSVGVRVQARRVELATKAAKSYIDAVNSDAVSAPQFFGDDDEQSDITTALSSCQSTSSAPYCTSPVADKGGNFYCVDGDGDQQCSPDSMTDMIVYAGAILPTDSGGNVIPEYAANLGAAGGDPSTIGYQMEVLVYRANGLTSVDKITKILPPTLANNAGLATRYTDGDNNTVERPLFTTKVDIAPTEDSFKNLCDRLGGC